MRQTRRFGDLVARGTGQRQLDRLVFDMINTVAYSWIPDAWGAWQRVPTRLTPRTFNVRLRATF